MSEGKLERDIESYIVGQFKAMNGVAYKFTSPNRRAVPDRLCILPNGKIIFIEVKRRTARLTPLQKVEIKKLIKLKQKVYVIYGIDQAKNLIHFLKEENYVPTR